MIPRRHHRSLRPSDQHTNLINTLWTCLFSTNAQSRATENPNTGAERIGSINMI
jgi:hypothetical protein